MSRLSDWWRGYSDKDIASVLEKLNGAKRGDWVPMTDREFKAYRANGMRPYQLRTFSSYKKHKPYCPRFKVR